MKSPSCDNSMYTIVAHSYTGFASISTLLCKHLLDRDMVLPSSGQLLIFQCQCKIGVLKRM
jgi:hypothetical protein